MDDLMCWECRTIVERTQATCSTWKFENIQGITFETCPKCQEKDNEEDDA